MFTSTQRDADWLADRLADMGHHVASLHGGMPQGRRNRVLQGLRNKQLQVLVATDVAARGIDVPTHQPRHQLRPADEGRGLRAPHRPHRPRRPQRPGGDAGRAHGRRHDPPHPAVHDAEHPGRDDRRPGAEEPRAAHVRGASGRRRRFGGKPFGKPGFGEACRARASAKKPARRVACGDGCTPATRPFDRDAAARFEPRAPHGDARDSPLRSRAARRPASIARPAFAPRKPGAPAGKGGLQGDAARPSSFDR